MKARKVVIAVTGCAVAVAVIARVFVGCASRSVAPSAVTAAPSMAQNPVGDMRGPRSYTEDQFRALPVPSTNVPGSIGNVGPTNRRAANIVDRSATTPSQHFEQLQLNGADTFNGNAAAAQSQANGGPGNGPAAKQSMVPIDQYDTVMVPTSNGEPAAQPQAVSGDRPTELWIVEKHGKAYSGRAGGSGGGGAGGLGGGGAGGLITGLSTTDNSLKNPEPQPAQQQPQDRIPIPGSGAMFIADHDGQQMVPVPLDHTDVNAKIQGYIASVHVLQHYHNPFSEKIEAIYVFPLPQDAAVSEFVMTIGDRHIRGIIREKEEAQRIYNEARSQGYVASLLTQDRPNIFTQKVANIEPNKKVDVDITYFNTMSYVDGSYEFVFPMVVGPRFNPPGFTDGVGAVERGAHGV